MGGMRFVDVLGNRAVRTLEETQVLSGQDRQLLLAVKEVVRRFLPTAEVLLYGSVARGTHGPESDYDVLVIAERPLSRTQEDAVMDAVFDLELERQVVISTLLYSKDEWDAPLRRVSPFHEEVERNAIII